MHFLHNPIVMLSLQVRFVFLTRDISNNDFSKQQLEEKHDLLTKTLNWAEALNSILRSHLAMCRTILKPLEHRNTVWMYHCRCLCILQVSSETGRRVHLAVNQPAYWRRWGVWIKFHPYALELFSHVSLTEAPLAFCCQRNYVTGFHGLPGINPPRLFRISFWNCCC